MTALEDTRKLWAIARRALDRPEVVPDPDSTDDATKRYLVPIGTRRFAITANVKGWRLRRQGDPREHGPLQVVLRALGRGHEPTPEELRAFESLAHSSIQGSYWSKYIEEIGVKQVSSFGEATERIVRSFDRLGDEIGQMANDLLKTYVVSEDDDFSGAAEDAHDRAVNWGMDLSSAYLAILGLMAVGLFHLFEQQANHLYAEAGYNHPLTERIPETFADWLRINGGLDVTTIPEWSVIVPELQAVANTMKHAEGPSAAIARRLRPDLFSVPGFSFSFARERIVAPMTGEGLYVTEEQLKAYETAVSGFWKALADALANSAARLR